MKVMTRQTTTKNEISSLSSSRYYTFRESFAPTAPKATRKSSPKLSRQIYTLAIK